MWLGKKLDAVVNLAFVSRQVYGVPPTKALRDIREKGDFGCTERIYYMVLVYWIRPFEYEYILKMFTKLK